MNNIEKFLTPRLKMIASLVSKCDTVCDIGTDHAYVAIYLVKSGKAKKVIATDINEGPLFYANKNIHLFNEAMNITLRQSDGFSKIEDGEFNTAVIAGMGGETIAEILREANGGENFVLQPQSAHAELRQYLSCNGFKIVRETVRIAFGFL